MSKDLVEGQVRLPCSQNFALAIGKEMALRLGLHLGDGSRSLPRKFNVTPAGVLPRCEAIPYGWDLPGGDA
ncbi:MAG: hypothetical protein ACYYK0_01080 [Candidatus Eutrophobiaceae bacterium]